VPKGLRLLVGGRAWTLLGSKKPPTSASFFSKESWSIWLEELNKANASSAVVTPGLIPSQHKCGHSSVYVNAKLIGTDGGRLVRTGNGLAGGWAHPVKNRKIKHIILFMFDLPP
jgi:hypothetical protein